MLSVLLLDTLREGDAGVSDYLKAACDRRDLPIKKLILFEELSLLLENPIEQIGRFNVFISSFSRPEGEYIELARKLRQFRENIFIIFVIDAFVDIASCVRPSVRPSGVLFVPLDKRRLYQTIKEIYAEYTRVSERGEQPVYTVKSGGEFFNVSTGDISFFEAQGKKIAIKTMGQEILFYSNFETVMGQLPDWFIRCHKGYVVNTRLITRASFTDMTLTLKDRSVIPISRTYRDEVRALLESKEASQ